jgi:hypothetical protein
MSHMVSLVYYEIWDFHIFFIWYHILFKYIMFDSKCPKCHSCFFLFCLIFLVSTTDKVFLVEFLIFFSYRTNSLIILLFRLRMFVMSYHLFLLNSMNYMFGNTIEFLWRTSKNHLLHNACVHVQPVRKK